MTTTRRAFLAYLTLWIANSFVVLTALAYLTPH
jgi:hypothetical protein